MERLIYSKFSNERNSRYAIETSIIQNEKKQKWVVKRPMSEDGYDHFEHIRQAYHSLKAMYPEQNLAIQPFEEWNGGLRFPFVEGEDMEKLLHRVYKTDGYEKMLGLIRDYFSLIREHASGCAFHKTEAFTAMFGDQDFAEGEVCGPANNLDYGFGNVILDGEKKTLIDYEWTVDFPVPLDFLLYRVIHYYVYTSPFGVELLSHGIFEALGFEAEKRNRYIEMEQHFQSYISSGMAALGDLHETMGAKTFNIHEMADHYRKEKEPLMQVYFDYGEGFVHENSYYDSPEVTEDGTETLIVPEIPENAVRVRIDPRKEACVIRVNRFVDENGNDMRGSMECNAVSIDDQVYVFNVPDPWFVVKHENRKKLTLQITLKPAEYVSGLTRLDQENQKLEKEIEKLGREKQDLNNQLDAAEDRYQEVIGSTSWKITEPLRKIGSIRQK